MAIPAPAETEYGREMTWGMMNTVLMMLTITRRHLSGPLGFVEVLRQFGPLYGIDRVPGR